MRKVAILSFALSLLILPVAPASADLEEAGMGAVNTVANTAFGWLECPKALWDEANKAPSRAYVGVVVTGPAMCGFNVGVRYLGNAVDWAKLPISWLPGLGKNVVSPAVYESIKPPVPLPEK